MGTQGEALAQSGGEEVVSLRAIPHWRLPELPAGVSQVESGKQFLSVQLASANDQSYSVSCLSKGCLAAGTLPFLDFRDLDFLLYVQARGQSPKGNRIPYFDFFFQQKHSVLKAHQPH